MRRLFGSGRPSAGRRSKKGHQRGPDHHLHRRVRHLGTTASGEHLGTKGSNAGAAIQLHLETVISGRWDQLLEHLLQAGAGRGAAPEIVVFLRALRRHLGDRKLLIVWDRLQAHRSRLVREYVESQEAAIHLEFLPPYAPELNPVEYLWAHWKHHELANFVIAQLGGSPA
jgi:hypothetical protein